MPEAQSLNKTEEIMRRIRILEERYSGTRTKFQFLERSILKDSKDIYTELEGVKNSISSIKSEMSNLNESIQKMLDEIQGTVKKSELLTLAKYVNFWEPLQYLTREEAEKLLKK